MHLTGKQRGGYAVELGGTLARCGIARGRTAYADHAPSNKPDYRTERT